MPFPLFNDDFSIYSEEYNKVKPIYLIDENFIKKENKYKKVFKKNGVLEIFEKSKLIYTFYPNILCIEIYDKSKIILPLNNKVFTTAFPNEKKMLLFENINLYKEAYINQNDEVTNDLIENYCTGLINYNENTTDFNVTCIYTNTLESIKFILTFLYNISIVKNKNLTISLDANECTNLSDWIYAFSNMFNNVSICENVLLYKNVLQLNKPNLYLISHGLVYIKYGKEQEFNEKIKFIIGCYEAEGNDMNRLNRFLDKVKNIKYSDNLFVDTNIIKYDISLADYFNKMILYYNINFN